MGIIDKIVDKMTDEEGIFRGGEEGRPLGRARDIIFGESGARTEELETGSTRVPSDQLPEDYYEGDSVMFVERAGAPIIEPVRAASREPARAASRYADPSMDPGTIRDEDVFNKLPGEADLFVEPRRSIKDEATMQKFPSHPGEEDNWQGTGMSENEFLGDLVLMLGGGAAGYGLRKLFQIGGREGLKAVERAVARRQAGKFDLDKISKFIRDWRRQYPSMKPTTGPGRMPGKMPPGAYRPSVEAKGVEALKNPINELLKNLPAEKAAILRKALESPALIGMTKKSAGY